MTTTMPIETKSEDVGGNVADKGQAVLDVAGLTIKYPTARGPFTAVDEFSLTLQAGQRVAIVGESGSGKTNSCMAIAGFLSPDAMVTADRMIFRGQDLLARKPSPLPHRSEGLTVILQDAMSSLDPVWTVGSQLSAVIRATTKVTRKEANEMATEWLNKVGLTDTERVLGARPYELSGGMRQRVMIALALSGKPKLLLADEPTSALDATLARELMKLMVSLADEFATSLLLVSHDIQLCREFTDRTIVMHGGKIVDEQASSLLAERATHPYTRGLLACIPTLDTATLDELPTMNTYLAPQHEPRHALSVNEAAR
jgi:peptide/nickel transport system ATP-binding protein